MPVRLRLFVPSAIGGGKGFVVPTQREGGIAWCDRTWNCVRGCSRVSEGCRNCIAERQAARFSGKRGMLNEDPPVTDWGPFHGFVQITNGHPQWTGKVELVEKHLEDPLHWRKPCKVFVNSMSDLFHEALPDEAIDRVFAVMALCPQHTFQILTKRPERMLEWFSRWTTKRFTYVRRGVTFEAGEWPYPNIWLGVSVEDQKTTDERIPLLLQTPAAVRFVSYEPALAAVDFAKYFDEGLECNYCNRWRGTEETGTPDGNEEDPGFLCPECGEAVAHLPLDELLDWIIVGGESGPGARPFDIAWARNTIEQCKAAGVACFVKQLGVNPYDSDCPTCHGKGTYVANTDMGPGGFPCDCGGCGTELKLKDRKGGDWNEWEPGLRVREFPKVAEVSA